MRGSTTTSSAVLPAVTRSRPSGDSASAWGRRPGSSTWTPSGVTTWLTGRTVRFAPRRPTASVSAARRGTRGRILRPAGPTARPRRASSEEESSHGLATVPMIRPRLESRPARVHALGHDLRAHLRRDAGPRARRPRRCARGPREARSRPLDPLNLWNLSWKADGAVPFTVLPEALTGVRAPIVVLSGRHFPTGSHKVGPAYSILVEKQLDGACAPGRAHARLPLDRQLRDRRRLGRPAHGLPLARGAARGDERRALREDPRLRGGRDRDPGQRVERQGDLRQGPRAARASRRTGSSTSSRRSGTTASTSTAPRRRREEVVDALGLEAGAFVSAMGSAGTIAAGEGLRRRHPGLRVVAVEPMQCPTLYSVGFGAHRIEGIGDKHVTWIHNVWATDLLALRRRPRVPGGPAAPAGGHGDARGGGRRRRELARSWVGFFGVSGVCNVLAAIRAADHYGLGPRQAVVTVATDGFDRYPSVLRRLDARAGTDGRREGAAGGSRSSARGARAGCVEGTPETRRRWHNQKYFTWVEQQGKTVAELRAQEDPAWWVGPAGAGARDRPPHPGAARLSFPGCVSGLACVRCGRRYARGLDGPCAACGPEGVLEIEFDLARARRTLTPRALRSRPRNAWRYEELLPVPPARGGPPSSPAGRRSSTRPGWRSGPACGGCSSRTRGATRRPPSRTGRAPWAWPAPSPAGRRSWPAPRPATRPPRSPGPRPAWACRASSSSPSSRPSRRWRSSSSSARGSSASAAATTRPGRCASGPATATAGTTATPP